MYNVVYDNIVIGGTYAGFGFLESNKDNNLLISKNVYLEDYSPAFRFSKVFYNTDYGKKLLDKLHVKNDYLNLAQSAVELYKMADEKYNILYRTFISEITDNSVTVHNLDGTNIIKCKNVIVTQKDGDIISKSFNALVEGDIAEGDFGDYQICPSCFEEQKVLKVKLNIDDEMDDARIKLDEIIHKISGIKLILTATEFDIKQKDNKGELLSCNIENPIQSYEDGYWLGGLV